MPHNLGALVLMVSTLAIGSLVLLVVSLTVNSPVETGLLRITLYSADGSVIRTWQSVKYADTCRANNRVVFTDPKTRQKVVLQGTIVIDDADFAWERPRQATHTVALYGLTKDPIHQWEAADFDAGGDNDRTVFYDMKTGHRVTIFGTTISESLPAT